MSSSTSTEERHPISTARKGSHTVEEGEASRLFHHSRGLDEHDRKRRRLAGSERSEAERDSHMDRFGKYSMRDGETLGKRGRHEGSSRQHHGSSRDPSRSRSEDGSRSKSPAASLLQQPRVGKRLRRAPQRWDGERREPRSSRSIPVPARYRDMDSGQSKDSEDDETKSANSIQDDLILPKMDDPVKEMRRAVAVVSTSSNRRLCVDAYHTWQLNSVSKQAGQQKALHVYLKRKLRKRTTRAPELERLEEDALRNARIAPLKDKDDKASLGDDQGPAAVDDEGAGLVPATVRLPLEAYLPRRLKSNKTALAPEDVLAHIPIRPDLPGSPVEENGDSWKLLPVPTVMSSSLNRHKPSSRYNKLHAVTAARRNRESERLGDE